MVQASGRAMRCPGVSCRPFSGFKAVCPSGILDRNSIMEMYDMPMKTALRLISRRIHKLLKPPQVSGPDLPLV